MASKSKSTKPSPKESSGASTISEAEQRRETSKAAEKCLALRKKARSLRKAAAGAGDPEERQRLLNQAIDAEIEAESFGKVAKYMRTGTFQGMAAGTGIGVMPGATLGALTGTLVGGTTSLITGSLGGALGSAVGAAHGPFVNLGEKAGEAIRGVTGTIPGWEATAEQKKQLEKMVGQAHEQEMPDEEELNEMTEAGKPNDEQAKDEKSWTDYATSFVPSSNSNGAQTKVPRQRPRAEQSVVEQRQTHANSKNASSRAKQSADGSLDQHPTTKAVAQQGVIHSKQTASSNISNQASSSSERKSGQEVQPTARKPPRKIEVRSDQRNDDSASVKSAARRPRKLEVRS